MHRGEIVNRSRAAQITDFSGLRIGNITPTDIDGLIEYQEKLYIFFELKYQGKDLPKGQALAAIRLVDSLNKPSVFIVADHDAQIGHDIDAAKAIIRSYYYSKKWHTPQRSMTLREGIIEFVNYIDTNRSVL